MVDSIFHLHPGLSPVVISKKAVGLAYKLGAIGEICLRSQEERKKTYKGFKKPRGDLPAATRRSLINAITLAKMGLAHEVPSTSPAKDEDH